MENKPDCKCEICTEKRLRESTEASLGIQQGKCLYEGTLQVEKDSNESKTEGKTFSWAEEEDQ